MGGENPAKEKDAVIARPGRIIKLRQRVLF